MIMKKQILILLSVTVLSLNCFAADIENILNRIEKKIDLIITQQVNTVTYDGLISENTQLYLNNKGCDLIKKVYFDKIDIEFNIVKKHNCPIKNSPILIKTSHGNFYTVRPNDVTFYNKK